MKKRLLFAFAMLLTVASGFAQNVGDYVYTRDGKYKITAEQNSGLVNADYTGWTSIVPAPAEGEAPIEAAPADVFTFNNGFCAVNNSQDYGISYELKGIDGSATYVVAVSVAQPEPTEAYHRNTRVWGCGHQGFTSNVNFLNIRGVNMDDAEDVVEYAVPTEIFPGEAKPYYFAITPSEVARTYTIKLAGWASDLVITDIKVMEALPVGDERTVAALLDHAKQILALRTWDASDYLDALTENIELAEEMMANADTQVEDMEGAVEGLTEAINDFQENCMDAFLVGDSKIGIATKKTQKVNNIGVWIGWGAGSGRIHSSEGGYWDVGHYGGNTKWGFGDGCIGLVYRVELFKGSYIFSMKQRACLRDTGTSSCWDENNGLSSAYSVMYIRPYTEGDDADFSHFNADAEKSKALVYSEQNLSPYSRDEYTISVNVEEDGWYEFGVKTYSQEHSKDMPNGGTFEPFDAQIYAKTEMPYSKAQYDYEADVRGQITAARENIETAKAHIADASTPWGKPELQAVVDEIEPVVAAYENWTLEEIIDKTYDKVLYDKDKGLEAINEDESVKDSETGEYIEAAYWRLMASEVYRNAAKGIIAANNKFVAKNDTLASLGKSVNGAENTLTFRIYDTATGKDGLLAAIAEAKTLNTEMYAAEYSEENAAAIVAMIKKIDDAIVELKGSIPASSITVLADINFGDEVGAEPEVEGGTVDDLSTANYPVTFKGAVGSMYIDNFSYIDMNNSCNIGIEDNGEILLDGILRLGNAEGITEWTAPEDAYGTDILRVTMDWWFGNLSGKNAGFYLKDAEDANVGGLYCNRYNGTTEYDPTGIFGLGGVIGRGSSTQSDAKICEDGNLTHLEYVIDYGRKVAYCVSTLPTQSITSDIVALENTNAVTKFVLKSNYNNTGRRCWFDNLRIERIAADPNTVDTGISDVMVATPKTGKIYTISGIEVKKTGKGIYIMNGKKVVIK